MDANNSRGNPAPMTEPTVSVCIVTCNHEKYIRQCIEGALAQAADTTIEILVGDDRSDDRTGEIVAELAGVHPDLLVHRRNDPRLGVWENLNSLLVRARGEFVAIIDGDDYWLPGKLDAQLAYLRAHPDCVAVYIDAMTVADDGEPMGRFNDVGERSIDLGFLLRRGNFLNSSSVLMRAECAQGLVAIEGQYLDYHAHLLHARKGRLAQIGRPLSAYRVRSSSSIVSNSNDFVRQLYWQAIMSVPRELVSDADFASGVADFMKRVVFRALSARQSALIREWAPRVFEASPYGRTRTSLLVAGAVVRSVYVESIGWLRAALGDRSAKVLYRR